MKGTQRLDEVSIFGDKLRLLIPHDWVEGDEGDNGSYLYHAPSTEFGWFRASLVTADAKDTTGKLREIFNGAHNPRIDSETGNYVAAWEKAIIEDRTPVHIYYWKVANAVSSHRIREAVFSYTVREQSIRDADTIDIVKLLVTLVGRATFTPE